MKYMVPWNKFCATGVNIKHNAKDVVAVMSRGSFYQGVQKVVDVYLPG